jgi:hypothetical protein
MSTANKYMQSASGVGGAGPDVDEVFSIYLTGAPGAGTHNINNGIDLAGEGGMVWGKARAAPAASHEIVDTERGISNGALQSNSLNAAGSANTDFTSFTSTGFQISGSGSGNLTYYDAATWSFRKAKKFFDVVTYTGDGTVGRNISHNLGSKPGCVIVKKTSGSESWFVSHRGYNSGANTGYLNMTNALTQGFSTEIPVYYATDTTFRVSNISGQSYANTNGATYVAYLWAHNDGDGEFGPDGDADIIKCGSYTNSGSAWSVDLGFEPQFLLRKLADGTSDWQITDTMRGLHPKGENAKNLRANTSNAENNAGGIQITPTGIEGTGNGATGTWIYIAIRRGSLFPPEAATEVFDISVTDYSANQTIAANIDVTDTFMVGHQPTNNNSNGLYLFSRLTGNKRLRTDQTFSENAELGLSGFDTQNGVVAGSSDSSQNVWNASFPFIKYFMKRAPNYFDVVAYTGNGTAGRTVSHNLNVAPEMMWVKRRDGASSWITYSESLGATKGTFMDTNAPFTSTSYWNDTAPTDSVFSLGNGSTNTSSGTFIAYLFASLDGVSKVGLVTHSGSSTDVDCGFASGARFVLLKRTDSTGDWYFWDTTRGIVSGNDPYLTLNGTNQPEVTNTDYIDPLSSGFQISGDFTDGTYIFYAIA